MRDKKYYELKKEITETNMDISVSAIQRVAYIGYNQACDYIQFLIQDGIIRRDASQPVKFCRVK